LGIVNRITSVGDALGEAILLADKLNARAPNALTSIKELINEAPLAALNQQLALERDHFVTNLHHVNAGIGISAFLAKQTPKFE
jgi:enoyl-CoA hydratase/carnithine racemase